MTSYVYIYFEGVEKNSNDCKSLYYRHSNKWNAASDILQCAHKLQHLEDYHREASHYKYVA